MPNRIDQTPPVRCDGNGIRALRSKREMLFLLDSYTDFPAPAISYARISTFYTCKAENVPAGRATPRASEHRVPQPPGLLSFKVVVTRQSAPATASSSAMQNGNLPASLKDVRSAGWHRTDPSDLQETLKGTVYPTKFLLLRPCRDHAELQS